MKRKKTKKVGKSKQITPTKLLFLTIILLFIVFEALYIIRDQNSPSQSNSLQRSVAGVTIEK